MEDINPIIYKEPRKTFMEILRVNNREVPFANLLAFFLRPKEKHILDNLFLKALLNTPYYEISGSNGSSCSGAVKDLCPNPLDSDQFTAEGIDVIVEQKTTGGKKIDLLVITEKFVICIEFKINHELNNPLDDYAGFVKKTYPNKQHLFIVLTPYKKDPKGDAALYFKKQKEFKQVILSHFFKEIIENMPEQFSEDEKTKIYYDYFKEFVQTVENRKIRSQRTKALILLKTKIGQTYQCEFHNNISGGFLEIKNLPYKVKIRIKSTGWYFEKWTRKNKFEKLIIVKEPDTIFEEVFQSLRSLLSQKVILENF